MYLRTVCITLYGRGTNGDTSSDDNPAFASAAKIDAQVAELVQRYRARLAELALSDEVLGALSSEYGLQAVYFADRYAPQSVADATAVDF